MKGYAEGEKFTTNILPDSSVMEEIRSIQTVGKTNKPTIHCPKST